jgi:hypothetical protein
MPGRIRVHLKSLGRLDVIRGLQQLGAQRYDLVVGGLDVIDVEVEVNLLRRAV